jgi:hypothetical protein
MGYEMASIVMVATMGSHPFSDPWSLAASMPVFVPEQKPDQPTRKPV